MPEMHFAVRWPDGSEALYYSPSLVVHDFLRTGVGYPVTDFLDRTHRALDLASERVRAKFGVACTSAMHTQEQLASAARAHGDGLVVVLRMEPPLEGPQT